MMKNNCNELIAGNTRLFKKAMKSIRDFSEITTIQGLEIIFDSKQPIFTRIFWLIVVVWMSCMGLYWSIQMYSDWSGQQVFTPIATLAQSVKVSISSTFYEQLFVRKSLNFLLLNLGL